MPSCEMCGRETLSLVDSIVEGTILRVCSDCTKFGNVLEIRSVPLVSPNKRAPKIVIEQVEEEISLDYAEKIKTAREKLNLTQEDLAKAIAERESIIHKLEAAQIEPEEKIRRKLEQFLKISLTEKEKVYKKEDKTSDIDFGNSSLTIGDLLSLKKNKPKKNEQKIVSADSF